MITSETMVVAKRMEGFDHPKVFDKGSTNTPKTKSRNVLGPKTRPTVAAKVAPIAGRFDASRTPGGFWSAAAATMLSVICFPPDDHAFINVRTGQDTSPR